MYRRPPSLRKKIPNPFSAGGGTSVHRLRWELLRPFARSKKFDRFQTLSNNSQQHVTACKRVCKRTQHVTSNNVGGCWLANNVTSVCTGLIDSYRRAHLFILPESLQTVDLLHIKLQLKFEGSNNTFVHLFIKKLKTESLQTVNLLNIELQLKVEGSSNYHFSIFSDG